jgi:hypothetical protein
MRVRRCFRFFTLLVAAGAASLLRMPTRASGASGSPYASWKNGPPRDPGYFPIAVWLQSPHNAARFKAAGINLYVGLWQGPTEAQLAALKAARMSVVCDQNAVGFKHREDPTIVGWMHGDEPDNAQALPSGRGYGGAVPASRIVADYQRIRTADPTRPVLLNLGQGVANDEWIGRAAKREDYPEYCKGADVVSFDVYPVAGIRKKDGENYLWYVPKGVDRLRGWTEDRKLVWNCIECTRIDEPEHHATPAQVRSEVWMSLVHGSRGLIYFVHQFKPRFIEAALLEDPPMLSAVTSLNRQIRELAPALNSPTVTNAVEVTVSDPAALVDVMVKRSAGRTYVFATGMRNRPTHATFRLREARGARKVTVLDENRTIAVKDSRFEDDFGPYGVHLYVVDGR